MKLIYTNDSLALVGLARNLLEEAGLEVMVKNELTAGTMPPYNQRPEVWLLDESRLHEAEQVLRAMDDEVGDEA